MKNLSWKYLALGFGAVLAASNAWWISRAIDAGITAAYQKQTAQECEAQAGQLEVIANHYISGQALVAVQPLLFSTAQASETFLKSAENLIVIGSLALEMNPDNTIKALVRDPYSKR